jgi:hypothetical protein
MKSSRISLAAILWWCIRKLLPAYRDSDSLTKRGSGRCCRAFKLQDAMRKASLGVVAWQLAMERRDDFEKKLAEAGSSVSPDATAAAAAGAGAGVSSATGPTSAAPAGSV